MGSLYRFNLDSIYECTDAQTLIYSGQSAAESGFGSIAGRFPRKVDLALDQLSSAMEMYPGPRLIFLDGGLEVIQYKAGAQRSDNPVLSALSKLLPKLDAQDVVIINNAWVFLQEKCYRGICPENWQCWDQRQELQSLLDAVVQTHVIIRSTADEGYIFLVPKALYQNLKNWLYILPSDPNSKALELKTNVPGVTSISLLRRVHDSRFATRYFKGYGIDVGGGIDSLALYSEFFPLVRNLIVYEREHGDGQLLSNIPDNSFDFLYSSHCLEHLVDPSLALKNWLRVVKKGGHLVFQIPDEDLYEQGIWPSRFNTDHKHTFTIAKSKSWSPVSINVLDLVGENRGICKVLSISQIDHGVRSQLLGKGLDQTRFPMAECGIEVVLQKQGAHN